MDAAATTNPNPTPINQHPEPAPQELVQETLGDLTEGEKEDNHPSKNSLLLVQAERENTLQQEDME